MQHINYSLLLAIVKRGYADAVMEAAKSAGARGGTLVKAKGTGGHEIQTFLGVTIEPEKDLLMILTPHEERSLIMKAIYEKAKLSSEGNGLVIALPVEDVVGAFNLVNNMKEESPNKDEEPDKKE